MTSPSYTLRELNLLFGDTTPGRVKLDLVLAATHEERLRCVEDAMDWIAQEFTKTRQERHKRGEDGLTVDIISMLKSMGFQASHDTAYGGHVDIVIEAKDDFLWLGEAKIHRSYDWLLKGFQQLDTRYSTGLAGQDNGGIVIYCRGQRMDEVMNKWTDRLRAARPDVTIEVCPKNSLVRRSRHAHAITGRTFYVRHLPISICFDPKDRS